MIDEKKGLITVTNENNEEIKVQVLFCFQIPDLNKYYVVYTTELDKEAEDIDIIISEFDSDANEIKAIPENEKEQVIKFYNAVKESLLKDE